MITTSDVDDLVTALEHIAKELSRLGMGNCTDDIGAIEGLTMKVKDGLDGIAESNRRIAEALCDVAKAIRARTDDDDD